MKNKLYILLLGMLMISFVSAAWSTDTFNNSLTVENLSFTGNQNITRWLEVPENTPVINGFLNLSGVPTNSETNDGYKTGSERGIEFGSFTSTGSATINAWTQSEIQNRMNLNDTTALSSTGCVSGIGNENYNFSQIFNLTVEFGVSLIGMHVSSWLADGSSHIGTYSFEFYNYTSGSWNLIDTFTSGTIACQIYKANLEVDEDYRINNKILIRYNESNLDPASQCGSAGANITSCDGVTLPAVNGQGQLVQFKINYTYSQAPVNTSLFINDTQAWSFLGQFNITEQTSNLANYINNYISSATATGGNFLVPFIFHSDTIGILQYFNLIFSDLGILELSQTYEEEILETEFNNFETSIQVSASSITNPELIYNGITYSATLNTVSDSIFNLTSSVIANESTIGTNPFYWNITLDGITYSTTTLYQNVSEINFSICDISNNITYLFIDFEDELSLSKINATIRTSTFNYYIEDVLASKAYTYSSVGNNSDYSFCFSPSDENVTIDASISYYGDIYPERTFGTDQVLSNITTNATLALLDDDSGLYATFKFIDSTTKVGLSSVNVMIYDGTTLVIEKKTDDSGVVSEWLNPNILYEIQYTKTGYIGGSQSIRPTTTDTYPIELVSDESLSSPSITNGLIVYYYPQEYSLDENTDYNFGFYASEGEEIIDIMKFTIYDEDRVELYSAEKSNDGNMTQQTINTGSNKTFLGVYEILGEDGGYWTFHRTYYITLINSTAYSLSDWGKSFDTTFPQADRTTLTNLIWYVFWFMAMIAGFTYGYNGSYRGQDDYRNNTSVGTRENTSMGLFFAYIITWIFCFFNMIPVVFPFSSSIIPNQAWFEQYFFGVLILIPLVWSVYAMISNNSRRGF